MVKLLLDWGANINMEGGEFDFPLQGALAKRHYETARLLVERGVNINTAGIYARVLVSYRIITPERFQSMVFIIRNHSNK